MIIVFGYLACLALFLEFADRAPLVDGPFDGGF